ncbi:glycosyltransferase [uncultured Jatrophihabitans sp.]|uniref:glycosyltransferase n=1 Tax=uncultured Jatrophihabitans sp. TaxID=1610747 RepID=UPI0035CBFCA4
MPERDLVSTLDLDGKRLLVAASTGGHLVQALRLISKLPTADVELVTFENAQSRALANERRVTFVPYIAARSPGAVLRAGKIVNDLLRAREFAAVASTGGAVALSALLPARARGIRAVFIESFSRFDGPSTSGRMLAYVPGIERYAQHVSWITPRWTYRGSIVGDLAAAGTPAVRAPGPPRYFVTLGTVRPWRFDSMVDAVLRCLPADASVVWQLGVTDRDDLPGIAKLELEQAAFDEAIDNADVVISHAGIGTAIHILERGKKPILIPRRSVRREHVDDHQVQACRALEARGLAVYREVDELTRDDLTADL